MVFVGGWRRWPRRRRRGPYPGDPYGPPPGYGYPPPAFGYPRRYRRGYGGSSCLRDMLLMEGGCCIAEMLGCGPQAVLLAPRLTRAALSGGRPVVALTEAITFYQREISPRRPASCRFTPTCSQFAKEALDRHGLRRGGWLVVRRLLRCRPGAAGGADPNYGVEAC